jgi:hypothetical protein
MENKTPLMLGIAAVAVIGIAIFAFSSRPPADGTAQNTGGTTVTSAPAQDTTMQDTSMAGTDSAMDGAEESSDYADGTYSAVGNYTSPAQEETVSITLTLANGVIESVEYEPETTNDISKRYQTMFDENFEAMVVGKSLDEVSLTKVSGSSLTPKGFNDAIEQIKQEARS